MPATLGLLLRYCEEEAEAGRLAAAEVLGVQARAGLKRFVEEARAEFPGAKERKEALDDDVMLQIYGFLQPFLARRDVRMVWATQFWALATLAYAVGPRSIEYLGTALTWSQLTPLKLTDGRLTVVLDLPFRKPAQSQRLRDPQRDKTVVPVRAGPLGPYAALERWRLVCGAAYGKGHQPVFSQRHRVDGQLATADGSYPYQAFHRDLRWVLTEAGVAEPQRYATHSFRSGCATRLLSRRVPWATVKRLIGWSTDEAMKNYDRRLRELAEEVASYESL